MNRLRSPMFLLLRTRLPRPVLAADEADPAADAAPPIKDLGFDKKTVPVPEPATKK